MGGVEQGEAGWAGRTGAVVTPWRCGLTPRRVVQDPGALLHRSNPAPSHPHALFRLVHVGKVVRCGKGDPDSQTECAESGIRAGIQRRIAKGGGV